MTKFKKGDRVKVITGGSAGRVGTVMEDSPSPWIKFDDHCPSVCNILPDHIVGSKRGHMDCFSENDLTLVDQPLSTTPDKVLQAAKTSPQAKDALKALFPDVFKGEPFWFGKETTISTAAGPVFIGKGFAPFELIERCLIVHENWEMRTQQYQGRTILTFHRK